MVKKMPRMDKEIQERFSTFFALLMANTGFNLDLSVFKKMTKEGTPHFE